MHGILTEFKKKLILHEDIEFRSELFESNSFESQIKQHYAYYMCMLVDIYLHVRSSDVVYVSLEWFCSIYVVIRRKN